MSEDEYVSKKINIYSASLPLFYSDDKLNFQEYARTIKLLNQTRGEN